MVLDGWSLSPALDWPVVVAARVFAALLVLAIIVVVALMVRHRMLGRRRGAFDCHVQLPAGGRSRWRAGVARNEASRLAFHSALGVGWWPSVVLHRSSLVFLDRRPGGGDPVSPVGVVLRCDHDGTEVLLAMNEGAASAFAVWVESTPPGRGKAVA